MTETNIALTCVAEEGIGRKLPITRLEDLLNEHLTLSDYGDGVSEIFFVFIAVSPKNTIHEPHIIYTEAEANLEIALKLPYEKILNANLEELLHYMKVLFLEGILLCTRTSIREFQWDKFYLDAKSVLE